MTQLNLGFFANGMFYSKLIYCLPMYGNVIGMEQYKEENSSHQSFTASDNQRLQVLQTKLNRLLLGAKYDKPTETLLRETRSLSVQQLMAYHSSLLMHKMVQTGKLEYFQEKFRSNTNMMSLRENRGSLIQ